MKSIEIDTVFGDKPVHIEISAPMGAGGSYQVMIDKYYNGSLSKTTNYGWQVHLHPNAIPQGDDVAVIIGLIEANEKEAVEKSPLQMNNIEKLN